MSTPNERRLTQARQAALEAAERAGIDRAFISNLVETFYGHIRRDERLGPIFEQQIGDNWEPHLATMKTFWGSLVFHDGQYAGRPMPAHLRLKDAVPEDFQIWLGLFERTLDEIDAGEEAYRFFLERADRIGRSFQMHMFYAPGE
ncbi:MAG: group III truncated hemoglobin [Alphaproteobacteria bacterium]|nr:group III truncated hemoglobin [Alphaproteobacteria bacterium]